MTDKCTCKAKNKFLKSEIKMEIDKCKEYYKNLGN